jgi:hypothetical protein
MCLTPQKFSVQELGGIMLLYRVSPTRSRISSNGTNAVQRSASDVRRINLRIPKILRIASAFLLGVAGASVAEALEPTEQLISSGPKVSPAPIAASSVCLTTQSEIFEISTRHLPDRFRTINFDNPNVEVNRWDTNRWQRSTIEDVLPTNGTNVLTILYVHGNFMERNNALERVRIVDNYFRKQADRPYRLIMLSWPSQREKKPLRDVLSNAESAECESLYVAWILSRLRYESQVSLLGFSFGARSVTGGLHLDAGGCIPGFSRAASSREGTSASYRLGLVAPAVDRTWIEPNGRHNLALSHVDSLVNLYNSRDPILRRFKFLDRIVRPVAAGFAGFEFIADPRATVPLSGQSRIRQYDCGSVIGTTHSEQSYYGECPYFRTLIHHLLWKETAENNPNACIVP